MDRQTALLVLQLPDAPTAEEIHNAFEGHVFQLRDFLFRQTIVPQVFRSKVNRLLTASEVGETLGAELTPSSIEIPELSPLLGTADQVVRHTRRQCGAPPVRHGHNTESNLPFTPGGMFGPAPATVLTQHGRMVG